MKNSKLILKKNEDKRIVRGHQWIFSNEIHRIDGSPESGDIIEILRSDGKKLGIGFYNPHSLIAGRLLSTEQEEIDFSFFERRINSALALRSILFPASRTYRLVHGESDFLPGLIVDRYDDFLSVQTFSAGMDKRLPLICDVLESIIHPRGIFERNESPHRTLEQLPPRSGLLRGVIEPVVIDLDGVRFDVDIASGQKTGIFLDQRMNRQMIKNVVVGRTVLDCFTNEGGFGLYASLYGAKSVQGVDSSTHAIAQAEKNAVLNSFQNISFQTGDCFEMLDEFASLKKIFELIILDPPSFTKNKKTVATGIKGYKELHGKALRLLSEGGILATSSCSHHIDESTFAGIVDDSVRSAGRKLRIISLQGASPDHPLLASMQETRYLTFVLGIVE